MVLDVIDMLWPTAVVLYPNMSIRVSKVRSRMASVSTHRSPWARPSPSIVVSCWTRASRRLLVLRPQAMILPPECGTAITCAMPSSSATAVNASTRSAWRTRRHSVRNSSTRSRTRRAWPPWIYTLASTRDGKAKLSEETCCSRNRR